MSDKEKYLKVLEGIPNLIKLHESILEKSKLLRQAFGIKKFKYQLIQQKSGSYSLANNETNQYVLQGVKPGEIKQYVKSNDIDSDDIFEAYLIFDHVDMTKYKKVDDMVEGSKMALLKVEQLERSLHYSIADYYIESIRKSHSTYHYQLISKDDNQLIIEGTSKEVVDKILEDGINPDYIYKVELLKHLFN